MNTENIDKSLFEFAAFDELESEHIAAPRYSYWKSVFRTFFKNKFTVIVSILLIAVVAFALIQPTRSGYSPIDTPNINNAEMKFLKPSAEHIFGTDKFGRDIFSRVLYGARVSMEVGLIAVGIGAFFGYLLGLTAGYFEGKVDRVITSSALDYMKHKAAAPVEFRFLRNCSLTLPGAVYDRNGSYTYYLRNADGSLMLDPDGKMMTEVRDSRPYFLWDGRLSGERRGGNSIST